MNTPHRSLPASSKGNIKDSWLLGFNSSRSSKHSRPSADSSNIKQNVGQPSVQTDTGHRRAKTKRSVRMSRLMAAMYPGMHVGHKYCVPTLTMVPKTMGWLWNTEDTVVGVPFPRGWRPGAIALGVKRKFIRPHSIDEPMATPVGSKGRKLKPKRMKATSSTLLKSGSLSLLSTIDKKLQPTLYVHKEKGVYRVTMQPISAIGNEEEEQPVKFKVAEDSASSRSRTSKSSSTIKIEYLCTGARRKPVVKPQLTEMSTQCEPVPVKEPETLKKEEMKDEATVKPKKKGTKGKSPSKDEIKPVDATGEKAAINDEPKGKIDSKNLKKNQIVKK